MRKLILTFTVLATLGFSAVAQQLPKYTFTFMNPYTVHPAAAGMIDGTSIGLIHKEETLGADTDGRPQVSILTANHRFSSVNLGIGGYVYRDKIAGFNNIGGQLSAAYHIPLNIDKTTYLGVGISGNFRNSSIDLNGDENNQGQITDDSKFNFDAGAGLYLHTNDVKFGFSVLQIAETGFTFTGNESDTASNLRHYYANVSYIYRANQKFAIEPTAGMVVAKGEQRVFEFGARMEFSKVFWVGGLYEINRAWNIFLGATVKEKFQLGVNYGSYTTDIDNNAGNIEVMLKLDLVRGKKAKKGAF